MKILKLSLAAAVLAMPLAYVATPVQAATAHNSQAGGSGTSTSADTPTGRHMKMTKRMKHKKAM